MKKLIQDGLVTKVKLASDIIKLIKSKGFNENKANIEEIFKPDPIVNINKFIEECL